MVIDFGEIKREVMIYDHKFLLPKSIVEVKKRDGEKYCHFEVDGLKYMIPRDDCVLMDVIAITCEAMCASLLRLFMVYDNVNYAKVTVWETETSSATDEWKRKPLNSEVEKIVQRSVERQQVLSEVEPDPSVRTTISNQR